jgi:hypothetical protein
MKGTTVANTLIGKYIILRPSSNGASVFFGLLLEIDGSVVTLEGARRIWNWRGAKTLSEVAVHGIDASASKVAVEVEHAIVNGWCELLPCTDEAIASIKGASWQS